MLNTRIDWCDATWNPVTGCLHGCEYCYAQRLAQRFAGEAESSGRIHVANMRGRHDDGTVNPYPWRFDPTFHRYRLKQPEGWKMPRNIFVCSMADLFGAWVPDDWIVQVLDACRRSPQHRYLFLTKNPSRYDDLEDKGIITKADSNFWLGSTTTVVTRDRLHYATGIHTFQCCEPMQAPWPKAGRPNEESRRRGWLPEWVIFGAETGKRLGKIVPEKAWVDNAVRMCRNMGAAVFMKESLREIMGSDFVQEYPWDRG